MKNPAIQKSIAGLFFMNIWKITRRITISILEFRDFTDDVSFHGFVDRFFLSCIVRCKVGIVGFRLILERKGQCEIVVNIREIKRAGVVDQLEHFTGLFVAHVLLGHQYVIVPRENTLDFQ